MFEPVPVEDGSTEVVAVEDGVEPGVLLAPAAEVDLSWAIWLAAALGSEVGGRVVVPSPGVMMMTGPGERLWPPKGSPGLAGALGVGLPSAYAGRALAPRSTSARTAIRAARRRTERSTTLTLARHADQRATITEEP